MTAAIPTRGTLLRFAVVLLAAVIATTLSSRFASSISDWAKTLV